VSKISILTASLGSTLCMIALFVGVALAAGPVPTAAPGKQAGLCFLHGL